MYVPTLVNCSLFVRSLTETLRLRLFPSFSLTVICYLFENPVKMINCHLS